MFQKYNQKYPQVTFRYLKNQDYNHGLFELLAQLTKAPHPKIQSFQNHLNNMIASNSKHVNIVGIDKGTGKLVAFGSIIICNTIDGRVGKIENIVTCKSVRGKGYGKVIIQILKQEGWKNSCVTITLFCQQKNVQFYNKLDFKLEGNMCAIYKD